MISGAQPSERIQWKGYTEQECGSYSSEVQVAIAHVLSDFPQLMSGAKFYEKYFCLLLQDILTVVESDSTIAVGWSEIDRIPVGGTSFPLLAFTFSSSPAQSTKAIITTAQLHGNERFGTKLLHQLLSNGNSKSILDLLKQRECTWYLYPLPNPVGAIFSRRSASGHVDLLRNVGSQSSPGQIIPLLSGQQLTPCLPRYRGKELIPEMNALLHLVQDALICFSRILMIDIHSGTSTPGVYGPTMEGIGGASDFYDPLYAQVRTQLSQFPLLNGQHFHAEYFGGYARVGDFTENLLLPDMQESRWGEVLAPETLAFLTLESGGVGIVPFFQRLSTKLRYLTHQGAHKKWLLKSKVLWKNALKVVGNASHIWLNPSKHRRQALLQEHVRLLHVLFEYFVGHTSKH